MAVNLVTHRFNLIIRPRQMWGSSSSWAGADPAVGGRGWSRGTCGRRKNWRHWWRCLNQPEPRAPAPHGAGCGGVGCGGSNPLSSLHQQLCQLVSGHGSRGGHYCRLSYLQEGWMVAPEGPEHSSEGKIHEDILPNEKEGGVRAGDVTEMRVTSWVWEGWRREAPPLLAHCGCGSLMAAPGTWGLTRRPATPPITSPRPAPAGTWPATTRSTRHHLTHLTPTQSPAATWAPPKPPALHSANGKCAGLQQQVLRRRSPTHARQTPSFCPSNQHFTSITLAYTVQAVTF